MCQLKHTLWYIRLIEFSSTMQSNIKITDDDNIIEEFSAPVKEEVRLFEKIIFQN